MCLGSPAGHLLPCMSCGEQELAREGNSERLGRENKKSMDWMSLAGQQAVVFTSLPNNKLLYRVSGNGTMSVRIFLGGEYLAIFFCDTSGVLRRREGSEEVCARQALRAAEQSGPGTSPDQSEEARSHKIHQPRGIC